MGGRGASSGMSTKGKPYGSQYRMLLESGNIKFVQKNERVSETLMETMTHGRIYVEVGGNDLLRIVQFDGSNKRNRVIERDKRSNLWHVHSGYFHAESGTERHERLNDSDNRLLEKVRKIWYNKKRT